MYNTGAQNLSALTGSELVDVDNGAATIVRATTALIAGLAGRTSTSLDINALTTVGAGTITAAMLVGGIVSRGGTQVAAFTDTTATAALIIAALPSGAPVGTSFVVTYANGTAYPATLSAGAGVTISGNSIVPSMCWEQYLLTVASATTVTLESICGGSVVPMPVSQTTSLAIPNTITVGGMTGANTTNLVLTGTVLPATIYTPTASEIIAAIPNAQVGQKYTLNIANAMTTTGIGTITANTSVTISGLATCTGVTGSNPFATFEVSITGASAVTLTRVA
jgi:hypothetical protein